MLWEEMEHQRCSKLLFSLEVPADLYFSVPSRSLLANNLTEMIASVGERGRERTYRELPVSYGKKRPRKSTKASRAQAKAAEE